MNNKIDDLYDRLIQKNKYVLLRNFLENNKNQIIKSTKMTVCIRSWVWTKESQIKAGGRIADIFL